MRDVACIKRILLENGFKEGHYLDKYIDLICGDSVERCVAVTQKHHIVPQYIFADNNVAVDNSVDNLVYLKLVDHALAHFYLMKAACTARSRASNYGSVQLILRSKSFSLEDKEFIEALPEYQQSYEKYTRIWSEHIAKFNTGRPCSDETRYKISSKLKGHTVSGETRCKIGQANKGGHGYVMDDFNKQRLSRIHLGKEVSAETRKKLRQVNLGKHRSEECKAKISAKLKGRDLSNSAGRIIVTRDCINKRIDPEELEVYLKAGWIKGRYLAPESKAAIIEANKCRSVSEETRKKISTTLKGNTPWNKGLKGIPGHSQSAETRQKISEAQRGRKGNSAGTIWVSNQSGERRRIHPDLLDEYISKGFERRKS